MARRSFIEFIKTTPRKTQPASGKASNVLRAIGGAAATGSKIVENVAKTKTNLNVAKKKLKSAVKRSGIERQVEESQALKRSLRGARKQQERLEKSDKQLENQLRTMSSEELLALEQNTTPAITVEGTEQSLITAGEVLAERDFPAIAAQARATGRSVNDIINERLNEREFESGAVQTSYIGELSRKANSEKMRDAIRTLETAAEQNDSQQLAKLHERFSTNPETLTAGSIREALTSTFNARKATNPDLTENEHIEDVGDVLGNILLGEEAIVDPERGIKIIDSITSSDEFEKNFDAKAKQEFGALRERLDKAATEAKRDRLDNRFDFLRDRVEAATSDNELDAANRAIGSSDLTPTQKKLLKQDSEARRFEIKDEFLDKEKRRIVQLKLDVLNGKIEPSAAPSIALTEDFDEYLMDEMRLREARSKEHTRDDSLRLMAKTGRVPDQAIAELNALGRQDLRTAVGRFDTIKTANPSLNLVDRPSKSVSDRVRLAHGMISAGIIPPEEVFDLFDSVTNDDIDRANGLIADARQDKLDVDREFEFSSRELVRDFARGAFVAENRPSRVVISDGLTKTYESNLVSSLAIGFSQGQDQPEIMLQRARGRAESMFKNQVSTFELGGKTYVTDKQMASTYQTRNRSEKINTLYRQFTVENGIDESDAVLDWDNAERVDGTVRVPVIDQTRLFGGVERSTHTFEYPLNISEMKQKIERFRSSSLRSEKRSSRDDVQSAGGPNLTAFGF